MTQPRDRLPSPSPLLRDDGRDPEGVAAPPPRLTCAACGPALPLETLRFDPGRQDVVHQRCSLAADPSRRAAAKPPG